MRYSGMGTFLYDTIIVFVRDYKIKSYNAETVIRVDMMINERENWTFY